MRRSDLIRLAALCSVLPILAARAQAQTTDSTGFRPGQWGAEFSLGSGNGLNPAGVGVLRFHSARRALVLDVSGQVSRQSGEVPGTQSLSSARMRLGPRWYRPMARSVLQSLTLGVFASHDRREQQGFAPIQGPTAVSRTTSIAGGVFAELGGSWMVTSQLSLGAAWQGNVQYGRSTQRTVAGDPAVAGPDARTTVWNASLGALALRAGVYF